MNLIPLFSAPLGYSWKEFWRTDNVSGYWINFVSPPPTGPIPFTIILLVISLIVFLSILIYVIISKKGLRWKKVVMAWTASYVFMGVIFAFRMDYTWVNMLARDISAFKGQAMEDRVYLTTKNDLFKFMNIVKRAIPQGEKIRSLDMTIEDKDYYKFRLGNYYLLPVMTSRTGRYVWTFEFSNTYYNEKTSVLSVYRQAFMAKPAVVFNKNVAVYEILEEL